MISIIIPSKNRPILISKCVQSILQSNARKYDIIVVDQSTTKETIHCIKQLYDSRLHFVQHKVSGKSAALNNGISVAKGEILAFTDDDCIVSTEWLSQIHKSFAQHPDIAVIFGRTLPFQAQKHREQICPCTFSSRTPKMITRPCVHYRNIGFGNNMAIRKKFLDEVGGFKTWLGPGSIGSNAEDAEIALRILTKGHKILYNPKALIYHNKWLTPKEIQKQHLSYTCGEMACYGYFHFQGHRFASAILSNNLRNGINKIKYIVKQILFLRWTKQLFSNMLYTCVELSYRGRGLFVGYFFSLVDPIR